MRFLDRFRRKKEEKQETAKPSTKATKVEKEKVPSQPTTLEQLCSDDKETYEALRHTMFLDPRRIETSMKEAAENGKKFEKENDVANAKLWYEIAGGLAIYEGNVKKVVEFFSQIEKFSPNTEYPILKNPEKAVAKAREYYETYLKD